jgi:SAM-dependent methyltransferase
MWYINLIPKVFLSKQLRQPSGLVGRYFMSHLFKKGNAGINDFVQHCLDLTADDDVLEIGFGPGYLTKQIADTLSNGHIEGVDFSATMLEKAAKTNNEHIKTGRVKLHQGDSKHLPMSDNTFDKLCTVNTIYFLDNPVTYFIEMLRVLKAGGRLVIGFRDKEQLENVALSNDVFTLYTRQEVAQMLEKAGFSNIIIESKEDTPFTSYCAVATKP